MAPGTPTDSPPARAQPRPSPIAHTRVKTWATRCLLVLPGLAIVGSDLAQRQAQISSFSGEELRFYTLTAVLSALLWGGLVGAAAQRAGWERWPVRMLLVIGAGFAVGGQVYFFFRYHGYVNYRSILVGTSMLPSVGQQLWSDRVSFLRAVLPPVAIAAVLPLLIARLAPLSRARSLLALDVGFIALFIGVFYMRPMKGGEQGATPDVLYLSSMGSLAQAHWEGNPAVRALHPGPRAPMKLPRLFRDTLSSPPRNVIYIVNESVRTTESCVAYDADCQVTPFTNEAARARLPLKQMRSVDSTTALSLAVMWSGVPATGSRKDFHTWPLIWEYASAAGFETAYWTSQNMFFANAGLWLEGQPFTKTVSGTVLEADASYEIGADDGKLVDAVLRDLKTLKEPFVGVVHLSNTHFPYKIDPDDAPFQPQSGAVGAGDQAQVLNRYKDAIYLQDKHLGRLLRELRAMPAGARTVVVYMSDHGEQIRERGAIGHTYSVHEEEIRTAAWIDAPRGTLTAREEASLQNLGDARVTALDMMPTMLDLMNIHDAPPLARFRGMMPGTSLLRGGPPEDRGVVLTNCSEIFACAMKNWGAMRGSKKLLATQYDHGWRCYDVDDDPEEQQDLGEDACPGLRELAEADGRGTPF